MPLPSFPKRYLAAAGTFLVLVPLLGLADHALLARRQAGLDPHPIEGYRLPPPAVLRAMSFGYNELAADLLWIRTIAYFTDHLVSDRDQRHLELHLKNIFALDEYFKPVYLYGSAMLATGALGRGTDKDNASVLAAIALSKRAHALFPDDYRFPLHIGAYYLGDLRSRDPRQRAQWRREGAEWVHRAALVGANIPWLPGLAAKVLTEQGSRDLAILRLQEVYLTIQDEKTRRQIAYKLKELRSARFLDELQTTVKKFDKAHRESPIAFVPRDLYLLVGVPKVAPFSLEKLVLGR